METVTQSCHNSPHALSVSKGLAAGEKWVSNPLSPTIFSASRLLPDLNKCVLAVPVGGEVAVRIAAERRRARIGLLVEPVHRTGAPGLSHCYPLPDVLLPVARYCRPELF